MLHLNIYCNFKEYLYNITVIVIVNTLNEQENYLYSAILHRPDVTSYRDICCCLEHIGHAWNKSEVKSKTILPHIDQVILLQF